MEREHLLDHLDHPVVAGFVGRVGEVDTVDRKLLQISWFDVVVNKSIREVEVGQTGIQDAEDILKGTRTLFRCNVRVVIQWIVTTLSVECCYDPSSET